jgi:hypothetical protein
MMNLSKFSYPHWKWHYCYQRHRKGLRKKLCTMRSIGRDVNRFRLEEISTKSSRLKTICYALEIGFRNWKPATKIHSVKTELGNSVALGKTMDARNSHEELVLDKFVMQYKKALQ